MSIPIVLGTANFGTDVSVEDAHQILDTFAELGGRTIDTANMYACWHPKGTGGDSERTIGSWLQKAENRSAFTIITKIGSFPANGNKDLTNPEGLSPQIVYGSVEKSLTRLKVDCIDILLAHHDDYNTPLYDTWKAFTELVNNGKVRQVGISNYRSERIEELADIIDRFSLAPISVVEMKYSIISPIENADFGKLCQFDMRMKKVLQTVAPQAKILGYSPLLRGLFEKDAESDWPVEYDTFQNRQEVKYIQLQAKKAGVSPSAFVIKKIIDEGIMPVIGVSKKEQLQDNLSFFMICPTDQPSVFYIENR